MNARILLKFLKKWRLHALVQLENSRVQLVLSAAEYSLEPDTALRATQIDYSTYHPHETSLLQSIASQFEELPITEASVVAMPRVFHLQLVPKFGITNKLLEVACDHKDVVNVRFGGVKSCVEIIIRRPKKDSLRPSNTIKVRSKNLRKVRMSAKTQVITPHAVKLEV